MRWTLRAFGWRVSLCAAVTFFSAAALPPVATAASRARLGEGDQVRSPVVVNVASGDFTTIEVKIDIDPGLLHLTSVRLGGQSFQRIDLHEGFDSVDVGLPDLPTIHRLVAVDPSLYYTADVQLAGAVVIENVILAPIQKDQPDTGVSPAFRMNYSLYDTDLEVGRETVLPLEKAVLAGVTVLPLKMTPIHYNPKLKRLTVWTKVRATVRGEARQSHGPLPVRAFIPQSLTPFQLAQVANLVANYDAFRGKTKFNASSRLLVVTTSDLADGAARLAAAASRPDVGIDYEIVDPVITPADLKARITQHYLAGGLDSVLIVGDETKVPLYQWSATLPGDSFYSFLDGTDFYADVGLGRIPAANAAELAIMTAKLERYTALQAAGRVSNDVLLVAHKEEYPGKYTANQEAVRQTSYSRRFNFVTQYAGAGAANSTVLPVLSAGPALVIYRGHGSDTAWYGWGSDAGSFDATQVAKIANADDRLSVFLEVACENGSMQNSGRSLAENLLLAHPGSGSAQYGAVGVLASTMDSLTTTNDLYNAALMQFFGNEANPTLGNVNALAANKLVRDNGGTPSPNTKMYILFAHPLLRPWIP